VPWVGVQHRGSQRVDRRIYVLIALGVAASVFIDLAVFDQHVLRAVVTPVVIVAG
jgi:hypothetical protein